MFTKSDLYQAARNIRRRLRRRVRSIRYSSSRHKCYDSSAFWDQDFYEEINDDSDTIGSQVDRFTAAFHYGRMEACVALALAQTQKIRVDGLLDIGSGTGHWTSFFLELFPTIQRAHLIEVSEKCRLFLRKKYSGELRVTVGESVASLDGDFRFDLVCMIGCAFHIVEDTEIVEMLKSISGVLCTDGLIFLNDGLPMVSYSAEFTRQGEVYKRLRSKRNWRRIARAVGLQVRFLRNFSWIRAPGSVPDGHLVCLSRSN